MFIAHAVCLSLTPPAKVACSRSYDVDLHVIAPYKPVSACPWDNGYRQPAQYLDTSAGLDTSVNSLSCCLCTKIATAIVFVVVVRSSKRWRFFVGVAVFYGANGTFDMFASLGSNPNSMSTTNSFSGKRYISWPSFPT